VADIEVAVGAMNRDKVRDRVRVRVS